MTQFLEMVAKKVKVPIMLDSTDHTVLEESLKRTQGKSLINSVNLEDGEERFETVVPLALRYGAAADVPSVLDAPPTARFTVELVADDTPDDLARMLACLRAHAPAGLQVVIVANRASAASFATGSFPPFGCRRR